MRLSVKEMSAGGRDGPPYSTAPRVPASFRFFSVNLAHTSFERLDQPVSDHGCSSPNRSQLQHATVTGVPQNHQRPRRHAMRHRPGPRTRPGTIASTRALRYRARTRASKMPLPSSAPSRARVRSPSARALRFRERGRFVRPPRGQELFYHKDMRGDRHRGGRK